MSEVGRVAKVAHDTVELLFYVNLKKQLITAMYHKCIFVILITLNINYKTINRLLINWNTF